MVINKKLTTALCALAKNFPNEVAMVMNADEISLKIMPDNEDNAGIQEFVDVVALSAAGAFVDAEFAEDVVAVLEEKGVEYENWC